MLLRIKIHHLVDFQKWKIHPDMLTFRESMNDELSEFLREEIFGILGPFFGPYPTFKKTVIFGPFLLILS